VIALNVKKYSAISTLSNDHLKKRVQELEATHTKLSGEVGAFRLLFDHMTEPVHLWQVKRDDYDQIRAWRLVDAGLKACHEGSSP
jgi:hypothetical protein